MSEQKPTYRDMVDSYGGKTDAEWDEHLAEPAAQPAPGDLTHYMQAVSRLKAERDEAVKHYELLHASFDSLMAERNALREQLADALTDLGWSPDKVQIALDAALKEGR